MGLFKVALWIDKSLFLILGSMDIPVVPVTVGAVSDMNVPLVRILRDFAYVLQGFTQSALV
jgi:hypothetical protein